MNNVSTTLPVQGMVWLFFSQGDDGCFHCWHMCTVSGSQCKHQDLYPSTIWSKNCLPLFHTTADVPSKHQIELPSVRCLNCSAPKLQKLFNSPERAWWCDAHSKLMPRHSMICPSIIQQQHCTIWSTVACVSGSAEWGGVDDQDVPGLQCCSYHIWTHCKPLSLDTCFSQKWTSTGIGPSAHRNWMTQQYLCLSSIEQHAVVQWSQSSMIMTCAFHGR